MNKPTNIFTHVTYHFEFQTKENEVRVYPGSYSSPEIMEEVIKELLQKFSGGISSIGKFKRTIITEYYE